MTDYLRLDKYLTDMGAGSRSEVKSYIKRGKVIVDDEVITKPETKVALLESRVYFNGSYVDYLAQEYIMINKPAGVITATRDKKADTILDLIPDAKRNDLFPVGRLDKDTEGLLLITNDGDLAHELLSPKKHVSKVYYAKIDGYVTKEDVLAFEEGVYIEKELKTKPGSLKILASDRISQVELTIFEGKFHQVKRMFEAIGKEVLYLKRISMGSLVLDENLGLGEYRALTKKEIETLKNRS
ncbi:MAG: pseudouridine synthase [Acetivibrio sp.]